MKKRGKSGKKEKNEKIINGDTNDKYNKNNKDNKKNKNEFEGYKKIAEQNVKNYEPIISSFKKQYIQSIKSKNSIKPAPEAVIFVSFSMPDLSLKQIIEDAARYQIPVVVRGLIDNSFKKTIAKVFELVKDNNKGGILINPMWFKQYAITAVPACIVNEGTKEKVKEEEKEKNSFDVIYGNIRIKNMLELIATSGENGSIAQDILNRNRGKP